MAKSVKPMKDPDTPRCPDVLFTPLAWEKTQKIITAENKDKNEITWMGILDREENGDVVVVDVYIPFQEVTGATTECDDVNICMTEAVADGHNPMMLRGWFHLHPGAMGTSPSGTDVAQTTEYCETWPILLRGIFNNKGSIQLDFYDMQAGWQYNNLDCRVKHDIDYDLESLEEVVKERVKKRQFASTYTKTSVPTTNGQKDGVTSRKPRHYINNKHCYPVSLTRKTKNAKYPIAQTFYLEIDDVCLNGEDAKILNPHGKPYAHGSKGKHHTMFSFLVNKPEYSITKEQLNKLCGLVDANTLGEKSSLFPTFEHLLENNARHTAQSK